MSLTAQKNLFDIESANLLEYLRRELGLKTKWQNTPKMSAGAASIYKHGDYRLSLNIDKETRKIEDISAAVHKSDQVSFALLCDLVACIIRKVSPNSDDCKEVIEILTSNYDTASNTLICEPHKSTNKTITGVLEIADRNGIGYIGFVVDGGLAVSIQKF